MKKTLGPDNLYLKPTIRSVPETLDMNYRPSDRPNPIIIIKFYTRIIPILEIRAFIEIIMRIYLLVCF